MAGKRLLLTGVYGPFGIKNKYAEGTGMQMELIIQETAPYSVWANETECRLYEPTPDHVIRKSSGQGH